MIKAINPKNQSLVNKAVKYLMRYDVLNDLRDNEENESEVGCMSAKWSKLNRQCEDVFDKHLDAMAMLPKNQQKIIQSIND